MKAIFEWLDVVFEASNARIKNYLSQNFEQFNAKGCLESSQSYHEGMKCGFESLYDEVKMIVEDAAKLKELNQEDWEEIKNRCENFINNQILFIAEYCFQKTGFSEGSSQINFMSNVIHANLKLFIEIQKQNIREELKRKKREMFKIFGSSVLAALLGSLLTSLI